jgi:transposase
VWTLRGEEREPGVEYTESLKTKMVQKMLPPNGRSASALAEETGLPQPTLSRWLREAGTVGIMNIPARKWTLVEKLRVLIEGSRLGESRLGEFLRREGLHEAQLKPWRAEVETALGEGAKRGKRSAAAKRIKALERELRRKDRALAEAAAINLGSSPRAWGTRLPWAHANVVTRFISTRVGNAGDRRRSRHARAVHPHARGERATLAAPVNAAPGSSPRAWGTRNRNP